MRRVFYPLGMATLLAFLGLVLTYTDEAVTAMDVRMDELLYGRELLSAISVLGDQIVIFSVSIVLILFLWIQQKNFRGMLFVFFSAGAGNALNQLLKFSFERARPELPHGLETFSFPSGHAMVGLLYLFTLAYFITERTASNTMRITVWAIAVVLAGLVGLSRVAGGEHFFSDVLAGWFMGYTWFVAVAVWYEWRYRFRKKPADS